MSTIVPFDFEHHQVRVIEQEGGPWFVLLDVCLPLGIADHHQVFERLEDDERGRYPVPTPGGIQWTKCVNESGLYNVILRSDKPEAKRFRKWVTSEVLPAIRKTGKYEAPKADVVILAEAQLVAARVIETQRAQITLMAPKAEKYDAIVSSVGLLSFEQAAKIIANRLGIKMGRNRLFDFARDHHLLIAKSNLPYQEQIEVGRFETKLVTVNKGNGPEPYTQVFITPKGLDYICDLISKFAT